MIKKFFLKAGKYAMAHKIISGIVVIAIAGGSYTIYKKSTPIATTTHFVFATAKKGSLTSAVTGSGQISALNQVDVTTSVSGIIDSVLVKAGDTVKQGQVLATIENRDALNAVSTSKLTIESDEIALQKAIKQSGTQAPTSSSSDLKKAYQSGYNAISNSFIDFPTIFQDISDIFYVPSHSPYFSDTMVLTVGGSAKTYKYQAGVLLDKAKKDYEAQYQTYKSITTDSDQKIIIAFLNTTYSILQNLSAALTGTYSTIDYIGAHTNDSASAQQINADKNTINSYLSKVNNNITSITNALTAISDGEDKSISVDLDVKSAELSLKQAKAALQDAEDSLADHTIRAPFDGIVAKVPNTVEYGNKISTNANVATIITKKMRVIMTLNEIDAAKVKVGQKANLTFDAISDLTVPGTVSEIDVVGTVNQGVVSYGVTISLDSTDERIKPGMTTSISISAGSKDDVIVVPSTAITVKGDSSYVMVSKTGDTASSSLASVKVQTGLSNDTMTEIISGLNEGDKYVARTVVTAAFKSATATTGSLFGGGNRAGGNTVRISP